MVVTANTSLDCATRNHGRL